LRVLGMSMPRLGATRTRGCALTGPPHFLFVRRDRWGYPVIDGKFMPMHPKLFFAISAAGIWASASLSVSAQVPATSQTARNCTFQSLSPAEKSRYQSRYRRRVRLDGQAFADQWLREQACMTAAERKALRPPARRENCRAVSRPVTSMDGSMTVGIGRKCK
jgi:hypothetical protein